MQLDNFPPRSSSPAVIPQDEPVYRVNEGKFFADDTLYEEGQIITWPDEPNDSLEPLNDLAREKMKEFYAKIDEAGRKVAEKAGRAYVSRLDAFENSYALAKQEGRKVNVLNAPDQKNILGAKRGRPRGKKIEIDQGEQQEVKAVRGRNAVNSSMGM